MEEKEKLRCFAILMKAAARIEIGPITELAGCHLNVGTMGVTLTMLRDMPDGSSASAQHILAWEEIALTNFDMLDELIGTMYGELMAHATSKYDRD